jgi:hypothetical protein
MENRMGGTRYTHEGEEKLVLMEELKGDNMQDSGANEQY